MFIYNKHIYIPEGEIPKAVYDSISLSILPQKMLCSGPAGDNYCMRVRPILVYTNYSTSANIDTGPTHNNGVLES